MPKSTTLVKIALLLVLCFHGSALFFTLDGTYDAYVHIFFADHYARSWFEPWEYRWYTGFTITSYPPLAHQLIALLSFIGGLKFGFAIVVLLAVSGFVLGIYRFSRLWVSEQAAGYAALFAVFASSIVQTIHIYGQLPTLCGIACLTNVLPEVYTYVRTLEWPRLFRAWSLLGVTVASHHVTTLFGMVFFIVPMIGVALLDEVGPSGNLVKVVQRLIGIVFKRLKYLIIFGVGVGVLMVTIIFPYWYWSKTDPITQVPIPHGSRDSFINVPSSGLMFFLIPLGTTLLLLPYVFRRLYIRRNLFMALSFSLLLLLGTGGTTPIPKKILGANAFDILTLDRFTFWASVLAIPFVGELFQRLLEGDWRQTLIERGQRWRYRLLLGGLIAAVSLTTVLIVNLGRIRPLQPKPIDVQPILNFLDRDMHSRWRFLTLGFGDQMAWLSAQTTALSIDGNYHSARRVIELTVTPIERLENAKFKGIQGIGSLQQFLTVPEKYHLKFIFSNDKFYDPMLYFAGWERVQRLENGILVWQKQDVPPLPSFLPSKDMPKYQKLMWGILPLSALAMMVIVWVYTSLRSRLYRFPAQTYLADLLRERKRAGKLIQQPYLMSTLLIRILPGKRLIWITWLMGVVALLAAVWLKNSEPFPQKTPESTLKAYYNALDFKYFREAYNYFEPTMSFDEYILQLSVRDGLVASYSKLDSMAVRVKERIGNRVKAVVTQKYVTPLDEYIVETPHELVERDGKWWIMPSAPPAATAPDQFLIKGVPAMRNQGKRTVTTATTLHEDIMDRPEMYILSASLVRFQDRYVVVGELQNTDYVPAHVTIEAQLFDRRGRMLVSYNAKYTTSHKVLPKEIIPFRVDFEETAWVKEDDKNPGQFNPNEFTAFKFERKPVTFKVFARAVVADKDLYRDAEIQQVSVSDQQLATGQISNQGTLEISVPQILMATYDSAQRIIWVDHRFLQEGVRPQRKETFAMPLPDLQHIERIQEGRSSQFFVNGLPQETFRPPYTNADRSELIPTLHGFVQFVVNSYIGE
ncbi:putative transmembrane protein precursor [Fibrisoma limi BUZ 3]|uniref:Putative transmembrane protein n=1 Tax=Fibrisoma limi BUZ 3 TaxID=1185876 RepID=I2GMM2_9BACT|nr:protein precursor [Fibrisoma limi]CCH55150.1 putative transmembrane protein precursor [Fibrisoma limi BUZ 3]